MPRSGTRTQARSDGRACAAAARVQRCPRAITRARGSGGVGPGDAPAAAGPGQPRRSCCRAARRARRRARRSRSRTRSPPRTASTTPGYCMGGGHGRLHSRCYDCSGAVSYVLGPDGAGHPRLAARLADFKRWGERGKRQLDHRLHEPGSRLRGDRRAALRHLDPRRRPGGPGLVEGRQGRARQRPVPEAPLRRPVATRRSGAGPRRRPGPRSGVAVPRPLDVVQRP